MTKIDHSTNLVAFVPLDNFDNPIYISTQGLKHNSNITHNTEKIYYP